MSKCLQDIKTLAADIQDCLQELSTEDLEYGIEIVEKTLSAVKHNLSQRNQVLLSANGETPNICTKRKRGRPKGSSKKGKPDSNKNKAAAAEGENQALTLLSPTKPKDRQTLSTVTRSGRRVKRKIHADFSEGAVKFEISDGSSNLTESKTLAPDRSEDVNDDNPDDITYSDENKDEADNDYKPTINTSRGSLSKCEGRRRGRPCSLRKGKIIGTDRVAKLVSCSRYSKEWEIIGQYVEYVYNKNDKRVTDLINQLQGESVPNIFTTTNDQEEQGHVDEHSLHPGSAKQNTPEKNKGNLESGTSENTKPAVEDTSEKMASDPQVTIFNKLEHPAEVESNDFATLLWRGAPKMFRCTLCGIQKKCRSYIFSHLVNKHVKHLKPYKCNLCGKAFEKEKKVAIHKAGVHASHKKQGVKLANHLKNPKNSPYAEQWQEIGKHVLFVYKKADMPVTIDDEAAPSKAPTKVKPIESHKDKVTCDAPDDIALSSPVDIQNSVEEVDSDTIVTDLYRGKPMFFRCAICSHDVKCRAMLREHIINKHNSQLKDHICDLCGKAFAKSQNLMVHMQSHRSVKDITCDQCDYRTHSEFQLKKHQKNVHSQHTYTCHLCGYSYKTKRLLAEHIRRHLDFKPFECEECGKSFKGLSQLYQHKKKHEEPSLVCDICGHKVRRQSEFAKHIKMHSNFKEFKCDLCDYQCHLKGALVRHKIEKHRVDQRASSLRVYPITPNDIQKLCSNTQRGQMFETTENIAKSLADNYGTHGKEIRRLLPKPAAKSLLQSVSHGLVKRRSSLKSRAKPTTGTTLIKTEPYIASISQIITPRLPMSKSSHLPKINASVTDQLPEAEKSTPVIQFVDNISAAEEVTVTSCQVDAEPSTVIYLLDDTQPQQSILDKDAQYEELIITEDGQYKQMVVGGEQLVLTDNILVDDENSKQYILREDGQLEPVMITYNNS